MLCLGADVELTLSPRSAHSMLTGGYATNFPTPSRTLCPTPAYAVDDEDEEMGEDNPGVGVFGATQSASVSRTNHKSSMKEGKGGDDIIVTLFHGDMVLLFGDDFEVCCISPLICWTQKLKCPKKSGLCVEQV